MSHSSDCDCQDCQNNEEVPFERRLLQNKASEVLIPVPDEDTELIERDKMRLTWENLYVSAQLPAPSCLKRCIAKRKGLDLGPTSKEILFNVSGTIEPGTLLAVMGASGAGKTTLMNVLAHQNLGRLDITGSIKVNGEEIGNRLKSISAYVQQEDLFIGTLTVREHLLFHALLRIDGKFSRKERFSRVDLVMQELGLTKCKNTIIGIPGRIRGISGGEKKRLSFASEVLTNPSLLFVDEPTSGLDSFMAQSVVMALQKMAAGGKTIVVTIHQPSSDVYSMFDSILLLSEGRVAYMGPTSNALPYFANLGYPCPQNYNPADHFIRILAIIPGEEEASRQRSKRICDHHDKEVELLPEGKQTQISVVMSNEEKFDRPNYKVGWCKQMKSVLWRASTSNKREPFVSKIKTVQVIIFGIICGLVFFQQKNNQSSIQNFSGALFFLIVISSFNTVTSALFIFPAELPVFLKEHKLGMYRTDVYFLSKTLAELPWYILGPFLFCAISYWMIGLRPTVEAFFVFTAVILMVNQAALSFGYLISTVSPTVQVATAIGPPLMMPFLLFGGYFLRDSTVPTYFIWLKYMSWFKYSFEALNINQWDGFGSIGCNRPENSTAPCLNTGNAVLENYGFYPDDMVINIVVLAVLTVSFRLLAFISLLIRASKK